MKDVKDSKDVKDFEMTEVPSIEFVRYRILQHEQSNYTVLSTRHQSTKGVGKLWYLKYFSCGVHLCNTSRLFLATPTLDGDIWTTNQNIPEA